MLPPATLTVLPEALTWMVPQFPLEMASAPPATLPAMLPPDTFTVFDVIVAVVFSRSPYTQA